MVNHAVVSVSQLNEYIKSKMDQDEFLGFVCVQGELSNYKVYPSGHHYFSLKDAGGALRCVMFKASAMRLRFRPENGDKVMAFGRVSVFPRDGAYQLYCEQLHQAGVGDLHAAFEQLKAKLEDAGLFDLGHKKQLPKFPERIAIVTSSAGAAIHDMLRIIGVRFPMAKVILLPVRVQGTEAAAEICGAIRYVNNYHISDVIITGRGGGSMEDLWAFNDERLAYTIFQSEIPIISAVGHEPDVTISDYVADVRAATPSNAAELVVPDQSELRERLHSLYARMQQSMTRQLKMQRQRLDAIKNCRSLKSPLNYLEDRRVILDRNQQIINASMERTIHRSRKEFAALAAGLEAMSPLKVLNRGYSVVKSGDRIITNAETLLVGDQITVKLNQGEIEAQVVEIRGNA